MSKPFTTYLEAINYLMQIPKYGSGISLNRFKEMAMIWDIDLPSFAEKSIHIVGSNGKGSVSAFASHLLNGAGLSVATYISPHLIDFNERISFNLLPIQNEELIALTNEVFAVKKQYETQHPQEHVGAYEVFTLIAAKYFFLKQPDVIVFEAGIGGRFDTTKCFSGKFAALVSIDYEHTNLLGSSLEEIAFDKSDILDASISSQGHFFIGAIEDELKNKIVQYNSNKGINVYSFGQDFQLQASNKPYHTDSIRITANEYEVSGVLSLSGKFQEKNAALAIATSLTWLKQYHQEKIATYIKNADSCLKATQWPGRLEQISSSPPITIDVGHSPDAVQSALDSYIALSKDKAPNNLGILVTGVSKNKQVNQILNLLAPFFQYIICTQAYHMGSDAQIIANEINKSHNPPHLYIQKTIEGAVEKSLQLAQTTCLPIYVAGGLFLAIEYGQAFKGQDPQQLKFF